MKVCLIMIDMYSDVGSDITKKLKASEICRYLFLLYVVLFVLSLHLFELLASGHTYCDNL